MGACVARASVASPACNCTLTWTTTAAETCTASGGSAGDKTATGGTEAVTPAATTTYTLRCVGTTEDTATVSVTVSAPPPPGGGGGGGGGGGAADWWLIVGLLALGACARSLTARKAAIT